MAWIAVDAGTSVIKAVAFDDQGREIACARERTDVLRPRPEFSEQSMESVWLAAAKTVREVAAQIAVPVEGLAITAQGDGCWLVDAEGRPTGPALLWNDGRAASIVERWRSDGSLERAYQRSGSVAYPGLSNALLAWLQQNEPQRLARSRWVLSCNGWLFAQFTGRIAAELSDASNPFSDVRRGVYSDDVFAAYALEHLREMLPEISGGDGLRAPLTSAAAIQFGLEAGLPVVMAPYDIVTTAYGAGVTAAGQACLILGTTICAEVITDQLDLTGAPAGTTIALGEGLHLRAMPTLAGCETLEWTARLLGLRNLSELESLAAESSPGAQGLLFLPYVSEAGERSPFLEPQASGSFHGLKLTHTRAEMARAVYEGLSYVIRECLAATCAAVTELRVCGGGARSSLWCQMIADISGIRVLRSADSEIGARGAFFVGLTVTQQASDLSEAAATFPLAFESFEPSTTAALYDREYRRFLATRETVRTLWRQKERA